MLAGLKRSPGAIIGALVLTIISSFLTTIPMVIAGIAIDELTVTGLSAAFVNLCLTIVGIALIYLVMYFVVGYVWAVVTLRWERDARQEFFEILQENSMTFHDQVDSKRLLAVAMQDITWVRFSLNPALRNLVTGLSSFAITGGFLFMKDLTFNIFTVFGYPVYVFTIIMVVGVPVYLVFAYRYANAVEPVRRKRSENMEQLTSISQGVFQGIDVVRAFGKEDYEIEKFHDASKQYEELVAKEGRLAAFYVPAVILIVMTTIAFFYGGYAVTLGVLSIGGLTEVLSLLVALQGFNFMLPRMILVLRGGYVNAQRIIDILNWEDPLIEPEITPSEIDWLGDVRFENVSFKYTTSDGNNDHYAVRNFSITIPGGSRVALIGGPGGGKTTLLKLILRLYDPTEGRITVGGVDLSTVDTKTVRDSVGLVEQDIFLFRVPIKENIAFGKENATDQEIEEAAKRAQAHEFISKIEDGYDAMVGERGMTLSGGQRQRLAIARAILQDPKILLLDDSVSAVDAQTEFLLRKALEEVMVGRTSITVTQRLRTLLESDLVIIIDKGRLVASGCHEELIETSEHYRHIFERLPGAAALLEVTSKSGGAA